MTLALLAPAASAVPQTKYYLSNASPSSVDVSTVPVTVTFTLTNCASTTAGCTKASTQSFGSADVTLPGAWTWGTSATISGLVVHSSADKTSHWTSVSHVATVSGNTVVELRNDGSNTTDALAPGEYLTFTVSLTPSPAGLAAVTTEVKQSNDFSGTGNDFLHASGNTDPTIVIGAPDHLEFGVPPQTVQQTTTVGSTTTYYFMCDVNNLGPTVRVVDKSGSTVTWVQGLAITLSSSGSPGLKYKATSTSTPSTTLQESTVNGVATFGSSCATGLSASTLGGGYVMNASGTLNGVALTVPTADRKSFDVLQYYQPCGTSCDTGVIVRGHTGVDVQGQGTGSNRLGASVGVFDQLSTCSGDDGNPLRSIVSVDLANHTKNVLLSWDKQAVQVFVNNGTPFWLVCMWGTYAFPTRGGGLAQSVAGTSFFVGVLPDCGDANVTSVDPCISNLYRRAGVEYAAVTLPLDMPGDPQFK